MNGWGGWFHSQDPAWFGTDRLKGVYITPAGITAYTYRCWLDRNTLALPDHVTYLDKDGRARVKPTRHIAWIPGQVPEFAS